VAVWASGDWERGQLSLRLILCLTGKQHLVLSRAGSLDRNCPIVFRGLDSSALGVCPPLFPQVLVGESY
jgi:hypothetical protein